MVPGLDNAMGQLRVGDHAVIVCSPSMGYGEAGLPPHVPPNTSIVYDVLVVSATLVNGIKPPSGPSALITAVVESRRKSVRELPR